MLKLLILPILWFIVFMLGFVYIIDLTVLSIFQILMIVILVVYYYLFLKYNGA